MLSCDCGDGDYAGRAALNAGVPSMIVRSNQI